MTRDDVLTPQQFADAIGRDLKSLERWTDLPWSVVNAHTKYMIWGAWLDYLRARTPALDNVRRVA